MEYNTEFKDHNLTDEEAQAIRDHLSKNTDPDTVTDIRLVSGRRFLSDGRNGSKYVSARFEFDGMKGIVEIHDIERDIDEVE